jgi:glycosyltransferase involved in cell wall biosynthesis
MENKPLISIIMPVYNGEKYLAESIESILRQTYRHFELIIINDASTDDSKHIAEKYAKSDGRIKIIDNTGEKGLHGALNSGLAASTGDLIARADADDINRPDRLSIQVAFLHEHNDIDVLGSGYQLFGRGRTAKKFHPRTSAVLAWKFISNTYFCHPSVIFRRSVLSTASHYPPAVCEDFAFFSQALRKHRGANLGKILLYYRQHEENYSNTKREEIQASIQKTFLENFNFYNGPATMAESFYRFHYKKELRLKDLFTMAKVSFMISVKILKQYSMGILSLKALQLYLRIISDLFIALLPSSFHHQYRVIRRSLP